MIRNFIVGYPSRLKRMNYVLLALVYTTTAFGLIFIYGTGQQSGYAFEDFWVKQSVWIAIGTLTMLIVAGTDYRFLGYSSWGIYAMSLLLLIAVLLFGTRINGAKSWLPVVAGVAIQPSEFAKLAMLILVSWVAAKPSIRAVTAGHVIHVTILTALPLALIVLQPDLGSAIVLVPITLAIVFITGLSRKWLIFGLIAAVLSAPTMYKYGLKDHQRKRLDTFLHPSKNPTREGWNARQSLLAVGSGGLTGKGFMKGTQYVLGFLPKSVAPTDFIFSVIAEETGFIGSSILISLFAAIMLLCIFIAAKARDRFGRNLACGISVLFAVHIYINIGMTIGMAPIIGIPLPFVSYGGSFMILALACVGVLQSIYIHSSAT